MMFKNLLAIVDSDGDYLTEIKMKDQNILAFDTYFQSQWQHAMTVDWDVVQDSDKNTQALRSLAKMLDSKLVLIKATYDLVDFESNEKMDMSDTKTSSEESLVEFFKRLGATL